jgi:hypothetical protein
MTIFTTQEEKGHTRSGERARKGLEAAVKAVLMSSVGALKNATVLTKRARLQPLEVGASRGDEPAETCRGGAHCKVVCWGRRLGGLGAPACLGGRGSLD